MTVREKVEGFLKAVQGINLGYNEIVFFDPEYIQDEQVGYSINPGGKTLITGKRGDWKENWLAIGFNSFNEDPVIVDMKRASLTVLTGQREEGDWQVFTIADGLDNFKAIVDALQTLSTNRTTEDEIAANPITDAERKQVLDDIKTKNPNTQMWYWENFLE